MLWFKGLKTQMALDIIKEQRLIRTLFYSLIQAAELISDNKELSQKFTANIEKYIRERLNFDEDTRETEEVIDELLEMLGWRNSIINVELTTGTGKVSLGKNRFIVKDVADVKGTLLMIEALFEGIGYHLLKGAVNAEAKLSLTAGSHYDISLTRKVGVIIKEKVSDGKVVEVPGEDPTIHTSLTIESLFSPIFSRRIPDVLLFDTAWKVITESLVANVSPETDSKIKDMLKNESVANLSRFIMKLTGDETDEEIRNLSELVGEFIAKILSTKIDGPLIDHLQNTLQDRHATTYLIYYDCRTFCANKRFENRCKFIRGMWVGILGEIYGMPITIKEVLHAGKRDTYCMMELITSKKENK